MASADGVLVVVPNSLFMVLAWLRYWMYSFDGLLWLEGFGVLVYCIIDLIIVGEVSNLAW